LARSIDWVLIRDNQVEHLTITPHSAQQAGRIELAQGVYDSLTQAVLDYAQTAQLGPELGIHKSKYLFFWSKYLNIYLNI